MNGAYISVEEAEKELHAVGLTTEVSGNILHYRHPTRDLTGGLRIDEPGVSTIWVRRVVREHGNGTEMAYATPMDLWLTPEQATARLEAAGYKVEIEDGELVCYGPRDVVVGSHLTIHDAATHKRVDARDVLQLEVKNKLGFSL